MKYVSLCMSLMSCATSAKKPLQQVTWAEVSTKMRHGGYTLKELRNAGPFQFQSKLDVEVTVTQSIAVKMDLFIPNHKEKAPLILFQHGNGFSKEVHREQAQHLASWGFYTVSLDLPNRRQWLTNANTIRSFTQMVQAWPAIVGKRIDTQSIFLVGHSFGGSAVTLATATGGKANGLILLDPAVVHPKVTQNMSQVIVPTILIGADPRVFRSRKRAQFYQKIRGPFLELSVRGATHNEAQIPSIGKVHWGFDYGVETAHQRTFLEAITIAAFSLTDEKPLRFAWQRYSRPPFKKKLSLLKRRPPRPEGWSQAKEERSQLDFLEIESLH